MIVSIGDKSCFHSSTIPQIRFYSWATISILKVREIQGHIWNPMLYLPAKISLCCFAAFHTDTETPTMCCTTHCLIQGKAFHTGLATMPVQNKVIREGWVRPPHTHKPGALLPAWFQEKEDCSHSYTGRNAHRAGGCPVVNSSLQACKLESTHPTAG